MAQLEKIMSIYYGTDKLPYKDEDRQTHYPIAGETNTFVGENNTTKVRFYVDRIGGSNYTWVAKVKKPNGTICYRVLEMDNDDYVEVDLSFLYTDQVGQIDLALNGYTAKDITITEDDGVYEISGNPIVICTGIIKIIVNYAPLILNMGASVQPNEYQQILALLSTKISYGIESEKVNELPTTGKADTIYYVKSNNSDIVYDIYYWNGTTFAYLGTTAYDLYTKEDGIAFENELRSYVDEQLSDLEQEIQQVASGSPKGVYATLSDLQTAYPTGAEGIYVISANGHWYYWNGIAWTDGGVYLSQLADDELNAESVNPVQNRVLTPEINDLNNAVFEKVKNIFPINPHWINGTINNSTGAVVPLATGTEQAVMESVIDVKPNTQYTMSWEQHSTYVYCYIVGYDENDDYLGDIITGNVNIGVDTSITFTTPNNCVAIRLRTYRASASWETIIPNNVQVELGSEATEYIDPSTKISKIEELDSRVETLEELEEENGDEIVLKFSNLLSTLFDGYIDDSGNFQTTSSWKRSDYIQVNGGQFIYFWKIYNWGYFAYFDKDKNYLGGKNQYPAPRLSRDYLSTHQVPANAKYIIVSMPVENVETAWGNIIPIEPNDETFYKHKQNVLPFTITSNNPCDYEGEEINVFRKGICIGDSITAGGFNVTSGTNPWGDGNVYSYPSQLQKMTGTPITNAGYSGLTTVQWYAQHGNDDLSGHDFAIIHLGINDVSYNVNISDTTTAYQNIINKLKTDNPKIKIFVCTIIPAYASPLTSGYDNVNAMIRNFANQENVYLVDLTTYGHTFEDSPYCAGHLTALGYLRMAEDIRNAISHIIHEKPQDFRFVQFIGYNADYE